MAFTLEDGTGIDGANAYTSVDDFKSYHKDRGATITAGGSAIEAAIIRATDFMESRWLFVGIRESSAQGLHFPAIYARYGDGRLVTGVPIEVEQSCSDYALLELNTPGTLTAQPVLGATGGRVERQREKVGPIETETHYGAQGAAQTWKKVPGPDGRLKRAGLVISGRRVLRS